MIFTFDSVEDFARACSKYQSTYGYDWCGKITYEKALDSALHGDESFVSGAQKLIDSLDVDMPETRTFESVHSPYGGRVNLGDWLAGSPTPMRRRVRRVNDFAPLKIVVSTTCSGGIDADTMTKRGCAILALLLKLQQVRPIQLYLLTELSSKDFGNYLLIRVESQPLALGVAAFGLCHVGFARHLTYTYSDNHGGGGGWPRNYYDTDYYSRIVPERLGLTQDDLIIKSAHINDDLVRKPVDWIKAQLAKRGAIQE